MIRSLIGGRPLRVTSERSRVLILFSIGINCLFIAIGLGTGLWYLVDHKPQEQAKLLQRENTPHIIDTASSPRVSEPGNSATVPTQSIVSKDNRPLIKEVDVPGGEVMLGGKENEPLRRLIVDPFSIAETEVTNEQYYQFIKETNYKAPSGWVNGIYLEGTASLPVTNVTLRDASAYCAWLSNKIGATVRLPTEAEWELAARGFNNYQYPWGNEWDDRAAASSETNGKIAPVKSRENGRSPFGAYDMAGNVWEWTISDLTTDSNDISNSIKATDLYYARGGAADEPKSFVSAVSRQAVPANSSFSTLGFRYVVVRSNSMSLDGKLTAHTNLDR
jgi:toxoflavin biosynthesis protein ToxD